MRTIIIVTFSLLSLFYGAPVLAQEVAFLMKHYPLHPKNGESIKIIVELNQGIPHASEAKLNIYEYSLFTDRNRPGGKVIERREDGIWGPVHKWDNLPNDSIQLEYVLSDGFGDSTLLKYEVVFSEGEMEITRRIVSLHVGHMPFTDEPILLYSASPFASSNSIDVCFISDGKDYNGRSRSFLKDLEVAMYEGYLNNSLIRTSSDFWAFYYSSEFGEANKREVPETVAKYAVDVFALIHERVFRDARRGNKFSTEFYSVGTLVHETAHAVFGLSDEYNNSNIIYDAPNIFRSLANCRSESGQSCRKIRNKKLKNFYTPEAKETLCIMYSDGDRNMRDFGPHCAGCIANHYAAIRPPFLIAETKEQPLNYSLDQVLLLKINSYKRELSIENKGTYFTGVSSSTPTTKDINLRAVDSNGNVFNHSFDDPRITHIDDGRQSKIAKKASGYQYIHVPYTAMPITITVSDKRRSATIIVND